MEKNSIVEFKAYANNDVESVEAVPTSWLTASGSKCYWPNATTAKLSSLLKSGNSVPQSDCSAALFQTLLCNGAENIKFQFPI